jgi:type I restriction enzyme S subunit
MSWTKTRLGEVAPFRYGKGLPKEKRIDGDVPVYGSNGMVGSHNQALINEPIVIIGRKGSVGEVHLTSGPSWPIDTTFYAESSDKIDLDFLFYLLQTLPLKSNSDSAVPGLSREYAHSLEVQVPDKAMQVRIGSILKLIDFKIASNSRISKTLEDVAQTIFKSWFVDFDPVKAKMAGEKPVGMDVAAALLFPDSMQDSELGPIPNGWRVSDVREFAPFVYGKALKASTRIDGDVPVFGSNGVVGVHNENLTETPAVVIGRKGTVGTVNLSLVPAWIIDTAFYCVPLEITDIYFVYFVLKSLGLEKMNSDAAVPGLNRDDAHRLRIVVASRDVLSRYGEMAERLFTQIRLLQDESLTLIDVRDSLLPRLITGELEIPEEMMAAS